jgi:hypothetical protein
MTILTDVLTEHCFEPDGDGRWFTNRHQFVRLSPDGLWRVLEVVAEGRTAEELAKRAHHPRWLDDPFGPVEKK